MHRDLTRHHHFFCNKELNEIFISVFLMNLAESMISLFVPIYLYSLGYSVVHILLFFLIGNIGNVLFSLPVAKVVSRIGAKHSVLISVPFLVAYYFGLQVLPAHSWLFYILPIGITFRSLLYNFGFELNFIDHADKKRIGRELSTMAILSVIASVLSPLVAGLVISAFGYQTVFASGSIILAISCLPLLISRDSHPKVNFTARDLTEFFSSHGSKGLILSFTGYAIESSIGRTIWPIFLIIILGVAQKVGYVAAASTFLAIAVLALAGRLSDYFNSRKLLNFATALYFFGWLGCLFADTAFKIFFINSYKNISERFLQLPWSSCFYKLIERNSYFQMVVARDLIYNISRTLILPLIMGVFLLGYEPFLISFFIAALFTLLYPLLDNFEGNK